MLCDAPATSIDWRHALDPGHVLILGEMHGTTEIPAFATATACDALRLDRSVGLFVEWPVALQDRLADEKALLADPFFTGEWQDGRRSAGMVGMVATAQAWRAAGAPLDVVAMDPAEGDRNAGMAAVVRTWLGAHPEAVAVVVVGNVHARLVAGWKKNVDYQPMGLRLIDLADRLLSLDVRYSAGAAWNCQPECGVHGLSGEDRGTQATVEWAATRGTYDGWYYVGKPTPSLPAVARPAVTP